MASKDTDMTSDIPRLRVDADSHFQFGQIVVGNIYIIKILTGFIALDRIWSRHMTFYELSLKNTHLSSVSMCTMLEGLKPGDIGQVILEDLGHNDFNYNCKWDGLAMELK